MSEKSTNLSEATSVKDVEDSTSTRSAKPKPICKCLRIAALIIIILASMAVGAGAHCVRERAPLVAGKGTAATAVQLRLPKYARPEAYILNMKLYLPGYGAKITEENKLKFTGSVTILMELTEKSNKIVLNSKDITFTKKDCVLTKAGKRVAVKNVVFDKESGKVSLELKEKMFGKQIQLKIAYLGTINDNLKGLYRSTYTNANGEIKTVAVTQMEPTSARLMVPCFDEPEYRSTWKITVVHPKGTTALSNGIEDKSIVVDNEFLSTSFKTTPSMSSYLLAVFVSDFVHIEDTFTNKKTNKTTMMRIWCRPEAKDQTKYALEVGVKLTKFYEELYGIPFPLEKQDMVALPDFATGGMENWGLITYREDMILYNNRTYTLDNKKSVDVTIAHELAHQWFGNLVTMKWWNDLWLNEGFANYMETIAATHISPYLAGEDHAIDQLRQALTADSLANSHPLTSKIETDEEIADAFDGITYAKGGSIIRMIKYVMGETAFNRGIQAYLTKFSEKNTESTDLWNTLSEYVADTSKKGPDGGRVNITQLALQWIDQMGYPLLTVKTTGNDVTITQERFKSNKNAKEPKKYANPKYGFKWDVPIWYETEGKKEQFMWIRRDMPAVIRGAANKTLILNSGVRSFVRVNYDENGWKKISKVFKQDPELFSHYSRTVVINDAFALVSDNRFSYNTLFDLVSYAKNEKDNYPLAIILRGLNGIGFTLGTEPESKVFKKDIRKLMKPSYDKVQLATIASRSGIEEYKAQNDRKMSVWSSYCQTKAPECLAELDDLFKKNVVENCSGKDAVASQCNSLAPELRAATYCSGIRKNDEETYKMMMGLYERETEPTEKNALMMVLLCTSDVAQLKNLIEITMDRNSTVFRMQDSIYRIYGSMASHSIASEFILNYFLSNWDSIYERFHSTSYLPSIIESSLTIRNKVDLEQVKLFVEHAEHVDIYQNHFKQSLEKAEIGLNWKKENFKKVVSIMEKELAAY